MESVGYKKYLTRVNFKVIINCFIFISVDVSDQ